MTELNVMGEKNKPHRRVHPDKKNGLTKKLKVSQPADGLGYTSPVRKPPLKSARQKMLEQIGQICGI